MPNSLDEDFGVDLRGQRRSSRVRMSPKALNQTTDKTNLNMTGNTQKRTLQRDMCPTDTNHDSPPPKRNLRKRKSVQVNTDPIDDVMRPLTEEERRTWKGWVELESDPVLFDYVLRRYGVKDVKIEELLGLDDMSLSYLPAPVYGLVFLFKYRDDDAEEVEDTPTCPKHVWFANQTTNNACATIALLNIVMNVPEIVLGEELQQFKAEAEKLTPPYRGKCLSSNDFIRSIHNSFARRMDILNADLCVKNDYEKWLKTRYTPKRKTAKKTKTNSRRKTTYTDEEEAGYHFIGYVPIDGYVWKLDGLQREPVNLGPVGDNWILVARDNIKDRAVQYGDDGANLMALCQSPVLPLFKKLAETMAMSLAVEKKLSNHMEDWRISMDNKIFAGDAASDQANGLTEHVISSTVLSGAAHARVDRLGEDYDALKSLYERLTEEQKELRRQWMDSLKQIDFAHLEAARQTHDHTPALYLAIRELSEAGVMKEVVTGHGN